MNEILVNDLWNKALSAYTQGNRRVAIEIFSNIADADARISFNLACIHIEDKNYSVALKLLKNALEIDNSLSVAYFQRAYVRYQQGNYDSAYKNYLKTIMLLGNKKQISFRTKGLEVTLYEYEVSMNMSVVNQAKSIMEQGGSDVSFHLFALPPGLFFRPLTQTEPRRRRVLKIETNVDVVSQIPKRKTSIEPLLNGEINESPAPVSDRTSFSSFRTSPTKVPYFTPTSPEHVRIKIFWNFNDAMALLSHRNIQLSDLVTQIRSKLQIGFDPTLINPKTGQVLSVNFDLWEHLSDPVCTQFQIRINESI